MGDNTGSCRGASRTRFPPLAVSSTRPVSPSSRSRGALTPPLPLSALASVTLPHTSRKLPDQTQLIQVLHRMVHHMLGHALYDPHALDHLATRLTVVFRLDFLCHAAVDLAGTYVERVSQPSFSWDGGVTLQQQLGNLPPGTAGASFDSSEADGEGAAGALNDLAVRCYLLSTSASVALRVQRGPEFRLAATGAAGTGEVDDVADHSQHRNFDEFGDSVELTIQTLTEEVHHTISNIVDAMADVTSAMDHLRGRTETEAGLQGAKPRGSVANGRVNGSWNGGGRESRRMETFVGTNRFDDRLSDVLEDVASPSSAEDPGRMSASLDHEGGLQRTLLHLCQCGVRRGGGGGVLAHAHAHTHTHAHAHRRTDHALPRCTVACARAGLPSVYSAAAQPGRPVRRHKL